jgi:hypothetical protein
LGGSGVDQGSLHGTTTRDDQPATQCLRRARAWVPAALGFGDKPRRGAPAGDLVYDLELCAVQ